jgi:hypothetical protein
MMMPQYRLHTMHDNKPEHLRNCLKETRAPDERRIEWKYMYTFLGTLAKSDTPKRSGGDDYYARHTDTSQHL